MNGESPIRDRTQRLGLLRTMHCTLHSKSPGCGEIDVSADNEFRLDVTGTNRILSCT